MNSSTIQNKKKLVTWLKGLTGVAILSISLINQIDELKTNITSPIKLAMAIEEQTLPFPDGPYVVAYQKTDDEPKQEIPYTSFAIGLTIHAKLTHGKELFIGNHHELIAEIQNYDYLVSTSIKSSGLICQFRIALPQMPNELAELKNTLSRHCVAYAFPDGTETINLENFKFGNGLDIHTKKGA